MCILNLFQDFRLLCLDEAVLALAKLQRRDIFAFPEDRDFNRGSRHTGYTQYIYWRHGKMGKGKRAVVPSCCVWAIRNKYPEESGQYVGFIPSRLR